MPATLYALPASHPCAAIEVALRLKGVAYRRVDMIPVVSKLQQWRRFGGFTVPGVVFEDGERVLGSREIVRSLEHRGIFEGAAFSHRQEFIVRNAAPQKEREP